MVSPKIEEKLSNLSAEYIYNEGIGNLLLLAISYTDRKKGEDGDMPFGMPEEIKKIRDKADSYILELEDILGNNELRISALNEVLELKTACFPLRKCIRLFFTVEYSFTCGKR